jgi:hypothetical protein
VKPSGRLAQSAGDTQPVHRWLTGSQRGWAAEGQSALPKQGEVELWHQPLRWSQTRAGWNMAQSWGPAPHSRSHRLSEGLHVKTVA